MVPWSRLVAPIEPMYPEGEGLHEPALPLQGPDRSRTNSAGRTGTSHIRARVEHPFLVIKRIFGFAKVRYRGLKKNAQRLYVACALTNLYLLRHKLAT